jgi:hypothetical protein
VALEDLAGNEAFARVGEAFAKVGRRG